ncbi:MAG: SMP-30/gluconolactonase/LRE family protein [Anaeromyxobacteraceae bacterium]
MPENVTHPFHPTTRSAALALVALLGAGCATVAPAKSEFVWPAPPEIARIRHVRAFSTADELAPSTWRKIVNALVPMSPRAQLRTPNGMALSPDERYLYVANPGARTLVRVDLTKGDMKVIGDAPPANIARPFGVGVDAEGNVYVSDQPMGEILVFDRDGKFLRRFGKTLLEEPISLAVDRKRQVLYVLNGVTSRKTEHRVEVFSLKGEHVRTMGRRGAENGQFNFASHLAVASDGRLFVADMLNFRVQVFDPEGQFVTSFGQVGAGGPGYFDKVKGVSFDTFGNIYVADTLHGVQIFNPSFQPLMIFGETFVQMPTGLVIDSRNHIYVSDPSTGMVHEFVLINTSAQDSFAAPSEPAKAAPAAPASPAPAPSPTDAPAKSPSDG